ncbi:MAG: response regulator transcription factor [Bacteroidota bacterium]
MKIIIADDHVLVRKGVKLILTEAYVDLHLEEASDGEDLLCKVKHERWDVIISDIAMPGRPLMEIMKEIRQAAPKTPILIVSSYPAEQYAMRFIKAGASCYLTKESAPEELVKAIEILRTGKRYFTQDVVELLTAVVDDSETGEPHTKLTDREFEVLKELTSGKTVTEISSRFAVSKNTISIYKTKILEKLQMTNTADLIRYSVEKGL